MRLTWILLAAICILGCGNTEYISRELRVEDRHLDVVTPDLHVVLPGVEMEGLYIVAETPPDQPIKVKTKTNLRTHEVTIDVIVPDTTVTYKDTTAIQSTTVVERPGFFENIQTGAYLLLAIAVIGIAYKLLRK
jgi:hypothetical protein